MSPSEYSREIDEAMAQGVSLPRRPGPLSHWLREAYPDPVADSIYGHARAMHSDVRRLNDAELDRESVLCEMRWAADEKPSHWLVERRARLARETKRRKGTS